MDHEDITFAIENFINQKESKKVNNYKREILLERTTLYMIVPMFIVGFYGMNVDMPFLHNWIAYTTMIVLTVVWILYINFTLR